MEPAILIITLLCGMLVSRVGLPPLIGYLATACRPRRYLTAVFHWP